VKIALTIWRNRISSVFESVKTLRIFYIEDSKIINRIHEKFDSEVLKKTIKNLQNNKVNILICAAVSDTQILIPFFPGIADKVLFVFLRNGYRILNFLIPGANLDVTSNQNFFQLFIGSY